MATCYICGRSPALYRRNVVTGTSHRMTTSSRGTNWNSTSVRQGVRSVCAECALNIDFNNKRGGGIFLSIFLGGLLLIPSILYLAGVNFLHLSGSQIGGLTVTGLLICVIGSIIANNNAKKWKEENIGKYLGTTTTIYKNEELGISDLDKSIEICKKIESEDKIYLKFQEEINIQIQAVLDETKNNLNNINFDYFTCIDRVIDYKKEILNKYMSFEENLDISLKELKSIMTDETFSNYQSGIYETKIKRKETCKIENNVIDQFVVSLFKTDIDNTLLELNNFLNENNREYPDDTVEDCDALLNDLKKIEQGINSYLNIGENKYKVLLTHINENQYNDELLSSLEKVKDIFLSKIKDCNNQAKEIENKSLQRKIELLQKK